MSEQLSALITGCSTGLGMLTAQDMRERASGIVIHLGSTMGCTVLPYAAPYTATKHALEGLVESLHYELTGTGVDVNILELGAFETAFPSNIHQPADTGCVTSYGTLAGRPVEFWGAYGEQIRAAEVASPMLVTDAIAELIEAPRGTTPLRLVIDPITGGYRVPALNDASERNPAELFRSLGADCLLASRDRAGRRGRSRAMRRPPRHSQRRYLP